MPSSVPFIDFHRHKPSAADGEFVLVNLFPDEADRYDGDDTRAVYSAGLHPWFIKAGDEDAALETVRRLAGLPRTVAVGEAGLDRLRGPDLETQKKVFAAHVGLASALGRPLVVHCVRTHQEIVAAKKAAGPVKDWIIHGFSSNENVAKICLDAGLRLSFGPALLKNERLAEKVFREIPDDAFFLETDDMGPGIVEVYRRAAEIRGVSVDAIKETILSNFERTFGEVFS